MRFCYFFLFLGFTISLSAQKKAPAKPTVDPIEAKVNALLAKMTLEEKIGQMTLFTTGWDVTGPTISGNHEQEIKNGKVGNVFNAHTVDFVRKIQKLAVENSRLKIPLLFGYDVIHGYKTIFPVPLAEAASWEPEMAKLSAQVAARECASAGVNWTFAPMVDIARDPRWGRVVEGSGEDTYLGTKFAVARVEGFQGDLAGPESVIACAKHYAAYGAAQAGRDYHTTEMSDRTLREVYLPPFKACAEAGVGSFMTAFNDLNGVPASGNKYLIRDILKKEWNYKGIVVTDYTSINEMVPHGYAADNKDAARKALIAGVDMDMEGSTYMDYLKALLAEKKVTVSDIDDATRRVLRQKFRLGLFDDPFKYINNQREKKTIMRADHLEASREVARRSFVLLKNDNELLPLKKGLKKIAVIGPLGNSKVDMMGNWYGAGDAANCVTIFEGIQKAAEAAGEVAYYKGCDVNSKDTSQFAAAVRAASEAEIVILAIGESGEMTGEAASRSDIRLPGIQAALVAAIVHANPNTVVVLMNGRPLDLSNIVDLAPSILEAWYPGTQGGHAIADVLFGKYNPSGKLPITFPRSVGQIPIFYNMKNTGRPMNEGKYTSKYLDIPNTPLFAFGYGLSYTKFEYTEISTNKAVYDVNAYVKVNVTVKNTGKVAGEEVVQLYVHDIVGSVTRPVRELKGFHKVKLEPGQTILIQFQLTPKDLSFVRLDNTFGLEAGKFEVFAGGNSNASLSSKFEIK